MLRCRRLEKSFPLYANSHNQRLAVLRGVDWELAEGTLAAIVGPSGSGKSTLLNLIGLLDSPTAGDLEIDGTMFGSGVAKPKELNYYRSRKIGFIFQFHHLLPELTVLQNVMVPLMIQGRTASAARSSAQCCLEELFSKDELASDLIHRTPDNISGGQCQRTAIARALVASPNLVIADEPTGNLDEATAEEVFSLLLRIQRERRATIVMVTHNVEQARRADVVLRLHNGLLQPT